MASSWSAPLVESGVFMLTVCWGVAGKCEGWCVKIGGKPVKLAVPELTCQFRGQTTQ